MTGNASAGDVNVYASAILVRPEQSQRCVGVVALQATKIIGVDDRYITLTGDNRFHGRGVVSEWVCRQVGHPAAHNVLGLLFAQGMDHGRSEERRVGKEGRYRWCAE